MITEYTKKSPEVQLNRDDLRDQPQNGEVKSQPEINTIVEPED